MTPQAQICFTPGTLILTETGLRPVESLQPGDRVRTKDDGMQPIRWTGRSHLDAGTLEAHPGLRPVRLAKDSIGIGTPARDLLVSPNHRILIDDWRAELLFGSKQVLATASALVDGARVQVDRQMAEVMYLHILFDTHQIIIADGAETESFQPSQPVLDHLSAAVRDEMFGIFPELRTNADALGPAARQSLKSSETQMLREQL